MTFSTHRMQHVQALILDRHHPVKVYSKFHAEKPTGQKLKSEDMLCTEEGPNERAAADLGIKTSSQTDTKITEF